MAWNEPGNGKDKDPWDKGSGQQPPDLDEVFRNFQRKLSALFGGGKKGGSSVPAGSGGSAAGLSIVLIIAAVVYLAAGFFIVRPAEEAAVFQFGRYIHTVGPGPHWIPPLVRSKQVVNVAQVSTSNHQAQMLTKDENIVSVELGVQYRIADVKDYLFNVTQPEATLEQVTDSAVRQVIGHSTLDQILTSGRALIGQQIKAEIIRILDSYAVGFEVLDVPMQPAKAPDAVKEAFDDAIKAQEDEQWSINRAQAYEKQKVPIAEGNAERKVAEAEAYKADVILQAEGDASKFSNLLPEYLKAPQVTKERLYLDTMQSVLTNTSKVFVDSSGSNNLLYLPLDKIMQRNNVTTFDPIEHSDILTSAKEATQSAMNSASANQARGWAQAPDPRSRDKYAR